MSRTLAIVKPDGVARGLSGKIIAQFEENGLALVAMKMTLAERSLIDSHYPTDDGWFSAVGQKTLNDYQAKGADVVKDMGTDDAVAIGKIIKSWLVDYLTSGPVVAMVLEGNEAVRNVRRIVGSTIPIDADPGSIRGRYSIDSATLANAESRPVQNLVHASGDDVEAAHEIGLWFPEL